MLSCILGPATTIFSYREVRTSEVRTSSDSRCMDSPSLVGMCKLCLLPFSCCLLVSQKKGRLTTRQPHWVPPKTAETLRLMKSGQPIELRGNRYADMLHLDDLRYPQDMDIVLTYLQLHGHHMNELAIARSPDRLLPMPKVKTLLSQIRRSCTNLQAVSILCLKGDDDVLAFCQRLLRGNTSITRLKIAAWNREQLSQYVIEDLCGMTHLRQLTISASSKLSLVPLLHLKQLESLEVIAEDGDVLHELFLELSQSKIPMGGLTKLSVTTEFTFNSDRNWEFVGDWSDMMDDLSGVIEKNTTLTQLTWKTDGNLDQHGQSLEHLFSAPQSTFRLLSAIAQNQSLRRLVMDYPASYYHPTLSEQRAIVYTFCQDNFTLTHVQIAHWGDIELLEQLHYYLDLNRCGRHQLLRRPQQTTRQCIDLISKHHHHLDWLYYALLRTQPILFH